MKNAKNQHGLTLIELMVTLAVFALITMLAFPGFRLYKQNTNRVTQINGLVSSLTLARSEAIKRNTTVTVCASANQLNCDNPADWTSGWIVFLDDNLNGLVDATDGNGVLDVNETIFFNHGRLNGANVAFRDIENGILTITYNARGISNTTATFMRCDDRRNTDPIPNQHARAVIVNATGRTRLSRDTDNSGIQEDRNNADLACP